MSVLDTILGGRPVRVGQGFEHTDWSTGAGSWMYDYGKLFCLDGKTHTGYDLSGEIGWELYAPVYGRVTIAGGSGVFTDVRYGNKPGTGELRIRQDNGNELILGHMARIDVRVGQRVEPGQLVGAMGTNNGPHVHVEYRIPDRACPAGARIVDPVSYIGGGVVRPRDPGTGSPGIPIPGLPIPGLPIPGEPVITRDGDWGRIAEQLDQAARLAPLTGDNLVATLGQNLKGLLVRVVIVALGAMFLTEAVRRSV